MMTSSLQLLIKERQGQTFLVHCCFYFIPVMFDSFLFFFVMVCVVVTIPRDVMNCMLKFVMNFINNNAHLFNEIKQIERDSLCTKHTHTVPTQLFHIYPHFFLIYAHIEDTKRRIKKIIQKLKDFFMQVFYRNRIFPPTSFFFFT